MRILLTGGSGLIGSHLSRALRDRNHQLICTTRSAASTSTGSGCTSWIQADFTRDIRPEIWVPRLAGVDAVVNAVGILRERGGQRFDAIHVLAPQALFDACVIAGTRRVIQISALGADEHARSRYHISKRRADDHLASLPLDWTIVQPSLVYAPGGTSARFFTTLASLPWIPVPGRGEQLVQPIHIEDLVDGLVALLEKRAAIRTRIAFVGPEPISLRTELSELRSAMGLGKARFLPIPLGLVRAAAAIGRAIPSSLIEPETLDMLLRGNTADSAPMEQLLNRRPRASTHFISPDEAPAVRREAELAWLLALLRYSIAAVWIFTGIVSLGLYPVELSYGLLNRVGVTGAVAPVLLYGAALMDLAFGLATLLLRERRWLWIAQMAAIVLYTLLISWRLPEFWLHPYGPVLKNLPMLAGIFLLYRLERR